ncbi:hypothetical protein BD309DRAFT_380870 [Dichomitus squalens]|nr:hypothetical protein BD309DRAFT_380870 [Dichomitus squalens]
MKDSPLPALPEDAASSSRIGAASPHTLQHGRPPQPSTSSRTPQARSQRAPQHSATMPPPPPSALPQQQQQQQQNIFRRITSRFRSPHAPSQPPPQPSAQHPQARPRPPRNSTTADAPQRKSTLLRVVHMPPMPRAPVPAAPPNDFTSLEQRQAALRARGLVPAASRRFRDADGYMMPLSEQEAEIDRRFTIVVPGDESGEGESESEATRIREAWLAKQVEGGAPGLGREGAESESEPEPEAPPPRKSDALERASRDGTIGERSPRRATFVTVDVDAPALSPNVGEFGARVASPVSATVEDVDFHTAPSSPGRPDDGFRPPFSAANDGKLRQQPSPPSSPSRRRPPASTSTSPAHRSAPKPTSTPTREERDPPGSPSAHSEKVSLWLRTSVDTPTPLSLSGSAAGLSASPRTSLASEHHAPQSPSKTSANGGSGTLRARKEKPPPIIVTHSQDGKSASQAQAIAVAIAAAATSDSEASTSSTSDHGRPSLPGKHVNGNGDGSARGRAAVAPRLAHAQSSSTRTTTATVPALSPTRTVSSSGAESALPTPTTTSHAHAALVRDASISRGSTSHSSDNGHDTGMVPARPRRGTGLGLLSTGGCQGKAPGATTIAAPVIMEEFSETEPSSEEGEFGVMNVPANAAASVAAASPVPVAAVRPRFSQEGVAVPRPPRSQTAEQAQEKAEGRKSFSLFGKKSLEIPRDTRTSSSMLNLRRAFTSSTKPRPKSTVDPVVVPDSMGVRRKRSKMLDTSAAPSAFPRGTMPPRQAVAPTMHSHGTIVHQAHFIEDDESRRLSEMAFLT